FLLVLLSSWLDFFFQAEDGIRDFHVTGVQTCALPILIRTLSYQVTEQLASGQLELLLAEDNAPRLPVSLLFQGGRRNHPNVRAFIDAVRQHLRTRTL